MRGPKIRHAYHELTRLLHPDKNPSKDATVQFLNLQTAYETLNDTARRAAYDKKLRKESDEPILVDVVYSRQHLTVQSESQLMYVLLTITPSPKQTERPNLISTCAWCWTVPPRCTARMDTVKSAAIELIRSTTPDDILSIVAFSDRAEVLVKAGKGLERHYMETQVQMMRDGGGTEIFQGLEAGFLEVQRHLNRTMVNHIFMITDGHTYGDEASCMQLADRAALQGVRITGLGIGTEWNDKFLDELTGRTGGSSFFIAKNNDLHTFMQDKFNGLNQVFAERVSLSLNTPPGVVLSTIFRVQPDSAILPLSNRIQLGSIQKTSGLTLLMEFVVPSVKEDPFRFPLSTGELNMVLPFDAAANRKIPLTISRTTGHNDEKELAATGTLPGLDPAHLIPHAGKSFPGSLRRQSPASQPALAATGYAIVFFGRSGAGADCYDRGRPHPADPYAQRRRREGDQIWHTLFSAPAKIREV